MAKTPARILVVEDEALVAYGLEILLAEQGYEVIGPAPSTAKALKLIAREPIDAALLDVNLGKERIDCAAEALAAAFIPFIFTTGYSGEMALPPAFRDRPVINKPYKPEQLWAALTQVLAPSVEARALASGIVNA
jgi:CheY-like chemotaxis protein